MSRLAPHKRLRQPPCAPAPYGGLYSGFSLWEVVVILTILAGLITAVLSLAPLLIKRGHSESQARLLPRVERQLRGFAVANGRLPCPDGDGDGIEDCALLAIGALPYKTLGLGGADFGLGRIPLRYGVYRNTGANADLATLVDRYNPTDADGKITVLNQSNGLDLCNALDNGAAAAATTAMPYTRDSAGVNRNVAYAVAVAGLTDADGANGLFDGLNGQAGVGFEASNRAPSATYDDAVVARSFDALSFVLSCDTTRRSLNALANAVAVTDEVSDQAAGTNILAIFGTAIAAGVTVLAGIKTRIAAGLMADASATLATASAELAAAIAACVASLGLSCGAIAVPAAAVVLAAAAVASAGTAVVLDAAAVAAAAVSTGLHAAIAVRASAANNPGSIDLTQAVADLQAALNDANANLTQARFDELFAIISASAARNDFSVARDDLVNRLNGAGNDGATAVTSLQAAIDAEVALDLARQPLQDAQAQQQQAQSNVDGLTSGLATLQCRAMGRVYDVTFTPPLCRAPLPADGPQVPVTQVQVDAAAQQLADAQTALDAANLMFGQAFVAFRGAQRMADATRGVAERDANTALGFPFGDIFVNNVLDLQRTSLLRAHQAAAATRARMEAEQNVDRLAASLVQVQCLAAGNLYDAMAMTCNAPPGGPGGTAITLFSGAGAILQAADAQGVAR